MLSYLPMPALSFCPRLLTPLLSCLPVPTLLSCLRLPTPLLSCLFVPIMLSYSLVPALLSLSIPAFLSYPLVLALLSSSVPALLSLLILALSSLFMPASAFRFMLGPAPTQLIFSVLRIFKQILSKKSLGHQLTSSNPPKLLYPFLILSPLLKKNNCKRSFDTAFINS